MQDFSALLQEAERVLKKQGKFNCNIQAEVDPYLLKQALNRLENLELAYKSWSDKTDWLKPQPKELGMHRADVLRQRIENLEGTLKELFDNSAVYSSAVELYSGFLGEEWAEKARKLIGWERK